MSVQDLGASSVQTALGYSLDLKIKKDLNHQVSHFIFTR